ncbi:MAG: hypothetical protein U0R78_19630 [Nocardioidaceae bacterium]
MALDLLRRARDVARGRLWEMVCADPCSPDAERAGRVLKALTAVVDEREAQLEAQVAALLDGFDPDRWLE